MENYMDNEKILTKLRDLAAELGCELITPSLEDKGEYDRVRAENYGPDLKIGLIKDGDLFLKPIAQRLLYGKLVRAIKRLRDKNHIRHTQEIYLGKEEK